MNQPIIQPRQKDEKKNSLVNLTENPQKLQPISARIEKTLYRDVKIFSARNDKKLNAVIEEALRLYIKNAS